jgi:hypothetical protein
MSALVIFTVGHTDVQLLEGGARHELSRERCGELHEQLAVRRGDWTLGDSAVAKAPRRACDDLELPEGAFQLCTPKLDAVLAFLEAERIAIARALILHTDRPAKSKDPSMAGPILQQRLRERVGIEATVVAYLSGSERLEDRGDRRDAILRREVVARIDGAIANAFGEETETVTETATVTATEAGPISHVVVAAVGGFPEVSSLTRELVRLRAGEAKVMDLDIPDARQHASGGVDKATLRMASTDPSAVAAAKRHALELVERGNFIAAWGAVAHLHDREDPEAWTRVFRWLYEWASSLPLDESEEPCQLPFPGPERRAANVAMRVELALRCGDIPRAVQGTVSFFEAAVWDHLYAGRIEETPFKNRKQRLLFRVTPAPGERAPISLDAQTDEQGRKLYLIDNFGDGSRGIATAYLQAHHSNPVKALLALEKKIPIALTLRNAVAHGEPRSSRLEEAQREMVRPLQLWSDDGDRTGFLRQPLIRDVLVELGVDEPLGLCDRLIQAVRAQVLGTREREG